MSLSEAKKRVIERQRRAAHLHYDDYVTIREIAEELDVSEKTVDRDLKSRSARGVKGWGRLEMRRFNEDLMEQFRAKTEAMSLEQRYTLISELWMMDPDEQLKAILKLIKEGPLIENDRK
jgi:predicted DNA-binding transcriptional regulator YafY